MNKYELVYDLKEHLDTYSQTYDDYIMSYGETDMIYHYIEEKDKEIERLQHNQEVSTKWEIKLTQKNTKLKEENKRLKSIIKEAIEYIEEHKQKGYRTPMSDDYEFWNELNEDEIKECLSYLYNRGSIKEFKGGDDIVNN